jgi:lipoprotein-anchoring transpeptidase ErfK/SrfK
MKRLVLAVAGAAILACLQLGASPAQSTTTYNFTTEQGTIEQRYIKRIVSYHSDEKPGTIIIDTSRRYLYYVLGGNEAVRYGIGVGREGFEWSGVERISRKAEWPSWTPPAEMRQRQPDLPVSMPGGPNNPLGARALYIGGTLYRIHGTNERWSIGRAMSSGCIRMLNEDVIDLYDRTRIGAKVIVQ